MTQDSSVEKTPSERFENFVDATANFVKAMYPSVATLIGKLKPKKKSDQDKR